MKIIINYEASWRNSFLNGSNNEPLPKKGRKFIGSMTELSKKPTNYKEQKITLETVMGVLNRLIGDQRKLYQARNTENYYFKDIEHSIKFEDKPTHINHEIAYIRNITGSTDQNSFTGAIKANDPQLNSDYSREFWGIIELDIPELCSFILDNSIINKDIDLNPLSLVEKIVILNKSKPLENTGVLSKAVDYLNSFFPDLTTEKVPTPYIENNGKIKPIRIYAASLYIQHHRLQDKFDMSTAISSRGTISGFSKRGFNGQRDFMTKFTTGKPKRIWGNPFFRDEFHDGEGKVRKVLTKANGKLEIELDIECTQAKEIQSMIKNAGVSSFYLGKKGLAYVSNIRV